MRKLLLASALAMCSLSTSLSTTQADDRKKPDSHAPIGVMGDHLHKKGEWMVGYKYRYATASGMHGKLTDVQTIYGEAPKAMQMGMHMAEIMYGVSDGLTLMVMPQYMAMDMLHVSSHGGGHSHKHEVDGWGDTEVSGLLSILRDERQSAHLNLGVSIPTGSIDKTFIDHHDNTYRLPYNMQFGSGTFDPILGVTYNNTGSEWSWGAQTMNYLRFYDNDNDYHLGNKYSASTWIARNITEHASLSFRLEGETWEDVSGRDRTLPLTAIAGADPDKQSGERLWANVGFNLLAGSEAGALKGQRLAMELGVPIYEHADAAQPDTGYRLTLGWQWGF